MKLKEIKPGMVIHCNSQEEYERLNEETQRLGLKELPTYFSQDIVYVIHEYVVLWNYAKDCNYTEFSDLIIPEMSAEKALQIANEICKHTEHCADCPMRGNCYKAYDSDKGKTVEVLFKWKSDHEKKEPEIEWVYRVFGAENNGEKFFQTEEEAIKRCEELAKSQKSKQYARYERVCRVKAVE